MRSIKFDNTFYLRNSNTPGAGNIGVTTPVPVVGDWNGADADTIGIYDKATGNFALRTSNTTGAPNYQFTFGAPNDEPLAGRWSPTATNDGIGVYRPSTGIVYLRNALSAGAPDYTFVIGLPGDKIAVGKWQGGTADGLGVYRPGNIFYLADYIANNGFRANYGFVFGSGNTSTMTVLGGNWTGSWDGAGVAIYQNNTFSLKNLLTTGNADVTINYGGPGDLPIVGHWLSGTYDQRMGPPLSSILVNPTAAPPLPNGGNADGGGVEGGDGPAMPADGGSGGGFAVPTGPGQNTAAADAGAIVRRIFYTYDGLDRLTSAQYRDNGVATHNYKYDYDLNSNRTSVSTRYAPTNATQTTTYTYNDADQLKTSVDSATGTTTNYTYNNNGGLVNVSAGSVTKRTLGYDSADRLLTVTDFTTDTVMQNRYDGRNVLNQQYRTTLAGGAPVTTKYLVDPSGGLSRLAGEYTNGQWTFYIPGLDLLGQDSGGAMTYFAKDALGSVRGLMNQAGAQTAYTSYDPYGGVLEQSASGWTSKLGYTGEQTDSTGLVYLRARFYNPGSGQFLSSDPYEGDAKNPISLNKYGYVHGNPINGVDPSGTCAVAANRHPYGPWWYDLPIRAAECALEDNPDFSASLVNIANQTSQWLYLEVFQFFSSVERSRYPTFIRPSQTSKPQNEPSGKPKKVKNDKENKASIEGEIEAGKTLAKNGYKVEYITKTTNGEPDLIIEGIKADVYTPLVSNG